VLKPQTYMNESGRSVGEALRYAKLDIGELVFHDELDLGPAKVRFKVGGGRRRPQMDLRSITAHVGGRLSARPARHRHRRQGASSTPMS